MFKNFAWKKFYIRVVASWVAFIVLVGGVSGFKATARETREMNSVNQFIESALNRRIADVEYRLLLKSEKVLKLTEELEELTRLNSQFIKENTRLRRMLAIERRARRRQEESQ